MVYDDALTADQPTLASVGMPVTGAARAVSAARAAISLTNGYIDHANSDLRTAYAVADSVGTKPCAGDGADTLPSGVDHLE